MSAPEILVGRSAADREQPPGRSPLGRLTEPFSADPVALPGLAALALLVAWAANQGGYPQTHWAPGGIVLLALLAIAVGVVGVRRARTPVPVRIAIGALAAYTALSFLSILWAKARGDAWEGADRTLVYLVVFALFATWRRPARSAALLLGAWALAMAGLAVFTVLHVDAAAGDPAALRALLPEGRLVYPAGYTNANAAMWMMACFASLILASARRVPWIIRGLLAGGAVALAGVALYSQSRGSVYSTPIVLALVFLLLPGRARTFATLVPVAAGVAALAAPVLHLDKVVAAGSDPVSAAHAATLAVLLAAVLAAALVAVAAAIEGRARLSKRKQVRVRRAVGTVGIVALVALVAGGLIAIGKPIARAEHEWRTFTSQKGYAADESGQSRLISGLGSSRSDFYRVAWHEFLAHPLLGIGADNFAVPYLRLRHSEETPHYPHSVELRTLAETGIVGALIAAIGLLAALIAVFRALRGSDSLVRSVAAAALAGFGYWVVHGSFDWFFEYAGLGGAAFMLLGLACSTAPPEAARITVGARAAAPSWRRPRTLALTAGAVLVTLAAVVALAAPWLSRLEVERAARVWPAAPSAAYASLREAASLNPLSEEPYVIAGTIALRLEELGRAEHDFTLALRRTPDESYATLELGAIASTRGESGRALALFTRTVELDPRYALARQALAIARRGGKVQVLALNRSILDEAEHFA